MKKINRVVWILVFVFGFLSPIYADNICNKTISIGDTVTDGWSSNCLSTHRTNYYDPYNPRAYLAKFYTFTLNRNADIEITITNSYDNVFYLLDGSTTNGTVLKQTSGGVFKAHLTAGTYTLESTSQYLGAYTLASKYNDLGSSACVQSINPGQSVSDGWVPACESSHRTTVDPYSPYPQLGFRAKYFTFSLAQDSDVRISVSSDVSSYIYILNGTGEFGTPLIHTYQNPFLTSLPAGDYTIELTTQQQYAPGSFTILLSLMNNSSTCTQELTLNQRTNGTWSNNCLIQSWTNTNNDPYAGVNPERATYYRFSVTEPSDFLFNIMSGDSPVVLNIYNDHDFSRVLHSSKSNGYYYASLGNKIETRLGIGTYLLEVTSYNQLAIGGYAFEAKKLANSACASQVELGSTSNGLISAGCSSQFRRGVNNDPYGPQPGNYYAKQFEFTLIEPDVIELSTSLANTNAYLYLARKDASGYLTLIDETIPASYWSTSYSQNLSRVLDKGTYVAEVTTYNPSNTSSYSFSVTKGSSSACQIFARMEAFKSGYISSTQCPSAFKKAYQIYDPYNPRPAVTFGSKIITIQIEEESEYSFEVSTSGFVPHAFLVSGIDRNGSLLLDQRFTDSAGKFEHRLTPGFYTMEITSSESSQSGSFIFTVKKVSQEIPTSPAAYIKFVNAEMAVSETGKKVVVTLIRLDNVKGEVSVDYATENGTAIAGQHFVGSTGTLTFADGEQSKIIEITLFDDNLYDFSKRSFQITLSNPRGAALRGANSALIVITDDDATLPGVLQFEASTYKVDKRDGKILVAVERVNGADGEASVLYRTRDGTAKSGTHYVESNGKLIFANGETRKIVKIDILDVAIGNNDLTFDVLLSEPSGSNIAGSGTLSINITKDNVVSSGGENKTFSLSFSIWSLFITGLFAYFLAPRRNRNKN